MMILGGNVGTLSSRVLPEEDGGALYDRIPKPTHGDIWKHMKLPNCSILFHSSRYLLADVVFVRVIKVIKVPVEAETTAFT